MKIYEGFRTDKGARVYVRTDDITGPRNRNQLLSPRNDLRDHSPDGFEWGYGGSGPAQLALALCADILQDDERARAVYQDFKFRTIARISTDTWRLTEGACREIIEELEKEREARA